jgi:glutathione S-transferase/RNA polymerase-associated protein
MIKLYEHPLSPYAQKVKIALYEKDIPFEPTTPNLIGSDPGFEAASPRREVPCLVDGDLDVFDSTIILEYLEDKWQTPPLLPSAPAERARVRMIEELCDTYYEAINWGLLEVRFFGRASGTLGERLIARGGEQIAGMHARLERDLGTRPWFNGDAFGWGDLSVLPYLATSAILGFKPPARSRLEAWDDRVRQRPSVSRCLREATAAMPALQQASALVQSGGFLREYRDHRLEWMMRSGGAEVVLAGIAKKNIRYSVEIR